MILLTIPLLGLCVSLVSVFIGLGGGILLVPLLPKILGLSVHEAVATSLLTIFFVVFDNAFKFKRMGLVKWPVVTLMGPVSALTAIVAARLSQAVDSRYILMALMGLLVFVGLRTLFSSFLRKSYEVRHHLRSVHRALLILGGGLAGLTSGFAGVGSGVILSPVMIVLRVVSPAQLVPTANANMACTTFAASMAFIFSGELVKWNQWGMVRWDISLGVFISASFFSHFLRPHQNKLPFRLKSLILGILLLGLVFTIGRDLALF